MRYAAYARYSTELQSRTSIADQLRLLREHVAGVGGTLVATYTDAAIGGSAIESRPGLTDLLADADSGRFDVVIAEALDRLSRDLADIAAIYKRLAHRDIRIHTLAEGAVDALHIGLKGTMNELFLRDLKAKIRRGMRGVVEDGRAPGGCAYGYDVVHEVDERGEPVRGRRRVNPEHATVIRRIYTEYAAFRSARTIAIDLNRDGIPAPRGGRWNASTINGNRKRGHGILENRAYIGELVWNHTTMRADPATARRTHRVNDEADWVVKEMPDWRIVDNEVWEKVQARKAARARLAPHRSRAPRHLLSGMLECGICGGSYTVTGPNRFGCSRYRDSGACGNNHTIAITKLERRILAGIQERLLTPARVAEYIRSVHAEMTRRRRAARSRLRDAGREMTRLEHQIAALIKAIEDGLYTPEIKRRMLTLEARRAELVAEKAAGAQGGNVVEMIPDLAGKYAAKVKDLAAALNVPAAREPARAALRALIVKVVLTPGATRGELHATLHASPIGIAALAANGPATAARNSVVLVVVEEGLEPPTRGL